MSGWKPVTKADPCPACQKPDYCAWAPDSKTLRCMRDGDTPQGMRKLPKPDKGGGTLFVFAEYRPTAAWKPDRRPKAPSAPTPNRADFKTIAERLRGAMTAERLAALAKATGLPTCAWETMAPGWADAEELRTLRAGGAGWADDRPAGAWAIAEHDGRGAIVGLSLRAEDGRKGAPAGAGRGVALPADLHDLPDPVLIVEGASDVAACRAMDRAAVGRPSNRSGGVALADLLDGRAVLVVGENDGKPDGSWPGRDGAKAVAQQLAGRWAEPVRWTLPPLGVKDVRAWLLAKIAAGLNPEDRDAMKAAGAELLAALEKSAKTVKPQQRSQADAIVDMAAQHYRLGRTEGGDAFAVERDGPAVAILFKGGASALRATLARRYRAATGKTPNAAGLADAMTALEGLAMDAEVEPIALRVGEGADGLIVVDIGDAGGKAVVISGGAWQLLDRAPILFRRTALTAPLPMPAEGLEPAGLLKLRELLNVGDDAWPLAVGWLVASFIPSIPHPVLLLSGDQGTGKSCAARLIVRLIDPSCAMLRSEPRDAEGWVMSAAGSWAVVVDNVSHVPGWWSDAICKAVTGDGWVRRKLYTDSDVAVLSFRRCIVLTSIDAGAMRGDLADRLMLVDLERIGNDSRRTETELDAAYLAAWPALLGSLLSAVAKTLEALPAVTLDEMPRMADFARVLAALDSACPELTGGRALELFIGQRTRIAGEVIESDAVALAVAKLMEDRDVWEGSAGELLAALTPTPAPKHWPANARAMSGRLRRIRPALLTVGIRHDMPDQADKSRTHRIEKVVNRPPEPPEPPETRANAPQRGISDGQYVGGTGDDTARPPADRPAKNGDSEAVEQFSGGSGGSGGTNPALSGRGRVRI